MTEKKKEKPVPLFCQLSKAAASALSKEVRKTGSSRREIIEAAVLAYCGKSAPDPAPPKSDAGKIAAIRRILGEEEGGGNGEF